MNKRAIERELNSMASAELRKIERESMARVVTTVMGKPTTRGELAAAFDKVKPAKHWKYPINAEVVIENDGEMAMISEAVVFFTGSVPEFIPVRVARPIKGNDPGAMVYRVVAAGYFATIGA